MNKYILLFICLFIVGCGGLGADLSPENLTNIKPGMTVKEVTKILRYGPAGTSITATHTVYRWVYYDPFFGNTKSFSYEVERKK